MAARGQLALRRQLQREIRHRAWLETNMPSSALLERCRLRIRQLQFCLSSYDQ